MAKIYEEPVGGLHNVLAVGTTLKGTIETESDFRLDGRVEGEIYCKGKIVVGPKGSVNGNIRTVNAEIFGRIEGTIHASETLVLKAGADLKGDIFIQTLEIEPGVKLNGSCTMSGKEHQSVQQAAANQQKQVVKS
jgi:cytoskeletal protein CcmA (bactofilin family)